MSRVMFLHVMIGGDMRSIRLVLAILWNIATSNVYTFYINHVRRQCTHQ